MIEGDKCVITSSDELNNCVILKRNKNIEVSFFSSDACVEKRNRIYKIKRFFNIILSREKTIKSVYVKKQDLKEMRNFMADSEESDYEYCKKTAGIRFGKLPGIDNYSIDLVCSLSIPDVIKGKMHKCFNFTINKREIETLIRRIDFMLDISETGTRYEDKKNQNHGEFISEEVTGNRDRL